MTESIRGNDVIISKKLKESTNLTADDFADASVVDSPIDRKKKKKSGAFGIFRAALFMLRKRNRERSGARKDLAKQDRTPVNNNANWTMLVGSMRPLHLQDAAQSPPPSPPLAATAEEIGEIILPAENNNADWTNLVGSVRPVHLQVAAQSRPPSPLPAATAEKIGEAIPLEENNNANWTNLVGSVRILHLQKTAQSPPPSPAAVSEKISEIITPRSPAASSSSGTMSQYSSAVSLLDLDNSSDEEEEDPDEVFDALTGDEMIDAKAEEFIAQFYKQIQLQRTARAHHRHHHSRGI